MSEPFLGTVMIWAPNFAPRGWAFCQGQLLAISTNSALFSLLGVVYGGNGTTTFGLPNLAGRVPIGQGQSPGTSSYVLGETSGTENVTLTQANLAAHSHGAVFTPSSGSGVTIEVAAANGSAPSPVGNILAMGYDADNGVSFNNYAPPTAKTGTLGGVTGGSASGTVQIAPTGSSIPISVLQPYQCLNYVIALEGVFPSRN